MPRILTQNLIPGMVVAEDVYTYNNQLVLLKDTELTDKSITKLEFYSIISVRVREDSAAASSPEDLPQDEMTYSQRIKASPEYKEYSGFRKNSGYQGCSKSNLRLLTGTERKVIYKGIKPAGIAVNFFIKGIGFQAQVESFIK